MSLATLVEYAQTSFGAPSISTTEEPPWDLNGGEDPSPAPKLESLGPPQRPPIPDWIRTRRPDEQAPGDPGHPWRIHVDMPPPPPPPNVDKVGADALAFYVPFHFYKDWGIYIRETGVKYLAFVLKGNALIPGDEPYLNDAESLLRHHEMWHAATEVACTRAELFARRSLYRQYFFHEEARVHEEALANAHAIRWTFRENNTAERLRVEKWMRRQDPGYRDFDKWLPWHSVSRGQNVAARFMTADLPQPAPKAAGAPHQFLYRGARAYRMPITRIVDLEATDASVVRPFPRAFGLQVFVYSKDHEPAHFHIKLLSNNDETRYLWPSLKPYEGNALLTGSDGKSFDKYWRTYKDDVVSKLRTVYPSLAG